MTSPVLERDGHVDALLAAVADARTGRGRVVVVDGEAGIGKTSLVRAFRARLARDVRVLAGACDDLRTRRPLGPLRDAARGTGGPLEAAVAAGEPGTVASAAVAELARPPVTVLVVEDVHWVDDATLDVLRVAGRRVGDRPGVLLLTLRGNELDGRHPVRGLLGELGGTRLRPEPLSEAAVARLAGDAAVGASVRELTGGNPFFVTEALAAPPGAVPGTVADAVVARLGRLPEATRAALEQLAVVPTAVGFELAEALLGDDVEVLDAAERRGMLQVRGEGLAFRHELARRAIEANLPAPRRERLNAAVVTALLAEPAPDLDRVVHHAVEAGDGATVARYAPAAGRAAARVGAHRQALAHADVALRHIDLLDPPDRARLLDDYAWELYNARRFTDAVAAAAQAVRGHEELDDRAGLGAALVRSSRHLFMDGETAAAAAAAARAVGVLEELPGELAYALTQHGALLALTERSDAAVAELERARQLATGPRAAEVEATCLNYLGVARTDLAGEPGIADLRESLATATAAGLHECVARGYTNLGEALSRFWLLDELDRCLTDGLAFVEEHGFWSHAYNLRVHRALLDVRRGDWGGPGEDLARLAADADRSGMLAVYSEPPHALLLARRGLPGAEELLVRSWARALRQRSLLGLAFAGTAIAEWAWLSGRPERAGPVVAELWRRRDRPGVAPVLGEVLRHAARAGVAVSDPGCPEPWASGLAGRWREAAQRWEAIGAPYEQALELADSGEAEATLAGLRILDGLGADAAAALVRARLPALGVTRVPRGPMPSTRANPAGLTDRQLAVLALLVDGATNAEIAARLVLSVRTVDHHVAAILGKLGVASRREAAARAAELDAN